MAKSTSEGHVKEVRLSLDRDPIFKKITKEMKYLPLRREKVVHSLFAGA